MKFLLFLYGLFFSSICFANIQVGVAETDITPSIGTYSAGCFYREGAMQSIHDPLQAIAIAIDNGEKLIVFCSVDHMGFLQEMTDSVRQIVDSHDTLKNCEIFISSSHTHSGEGHYLDFGEIAELIAGPYDNNSVKICVEKVASTIIKACENRQPAKIGIGYGKVEGLTTYAGVYPKNLNAPSDLMVIKATKLDGSPLAVFFNYSLYPDVLVRTSDTMNIPDEQTLMGFSADVIGYVRHHVQSLIDNNVTSIFFNGAKGELLTNILFPEDRFKSCDIIAKKLALGVLDLWNEIEVKSNLDILLLKDVYTLETKPTPSGFLFPLNAFSTEMNLIILDKIHALITIPAELSCSLDSHFKNKAQKFGFKLSILDIVNDAHGYIYSVESWNENPEEVEFSWGGKMYGQILEDKIFKLFNTARQNMENSANFFFNNFSLRKNIRD